MLRKFWIKQRSPAGRDAPAQRGSFSFQVMLWAIWSLVVSAVGYAAWHADLIVGRPINTVGLAIHCVVVGVIGLVIMTLIEMHVEPWRFTDEE